MLVPCTHAACPNTDIQRPGRGLRADDWSEAHGLTDNLAATRYTRSVGRKEVLSRRHWREEKLECLRRRAKAKLVRRPGGEYEGEEGDGGIACFSLIGIPIGFCVE